MKNDVGITDGKMIFSCPVETETIGVRPTLTLSIKKEGLVLLIGSKIELFSMQWTMVGEQDGNVRVLCDDIIAHRRYCEEDVFWEVSELKTWLEDWLAYVAMGMDDVVLTSDRTPGNVYRIGKYDMILLKEADGECHMLAKECYAKDAVFDYETNKYKNSNVDSICYEFAREIKDIVGDENIVKHCVEYTSSDGSKKYVPIERKASLLTLNMFKEYEDVLKEHNPEKWWWLATPWKETEWGVSCVSPGGDIICNGYDYNYNGSGVRPFCILKSSILESCE